MGVSLMVSNIVSVSHVWFSLTARGRVSPSQCQLCLVQSHREREGVSLSVSTMFGSVHSERVGVSLSVSAMFGSVSQRERGCLPHGLEQGSLSQCQPCLIQSHSEREGVSLSVSAMFDSVSQREGGCLPLSVSHV